MKSSLHLQLLHLRGVWPLAASSASMLLRLAYWNHIYSVPLELGLFEQLRYLFLSRPTYNQLGESSQQL